MLDNPDDGPDKRVRNVTFFSLAPDWTRNFPFNVKFTQKRLSHQPYTRIIQNQTAIKSDNHNRILRLPRSDLKNIFNFSLSYFDNVVGHLTEFRNQMFLHWRRELWISIKARSGRSFDSS